MAVTETITWKQFRDAFLKQYYSAKVRLQKLSEFENLLQTPDMSVGVYTSQSNALGTYVICLGNYGRRSSEIAQIQRE